MGAMKAMKKAMKKKAAAPAPKAMKAMKKAMKRAMKHAAAPAPKAMKAMKKAMKAMRAMKAGAMTQTAVFQSVAEKTGLKTKDAKGVVDAFMEVAVSQVQKSGSFKVAGMLN